MSLDVVLDSKVGRFLCWPRFDLDVAIGRVDQLKGLQVEAVSLGGPHRVLGFDILGKGHVGVVLLARWNGEEVALKVRRTDADRVSMVNEASLLEKVNGLGIGPRLHVFSDDFIVMERIVGQYLGDWTRDYVGDEEGFKDVVRVLLWKVRALDVAGIDHGELNRVRRHFIVTGEGPRIIDFESASVSRRARNVTSTVQSLFMNYGFAGLLRERMVFPDRDLLLASLRVYRRDPCDECFLGLLGVLGLDGKV